MTTKARKPKKKTISKKAESLADYQAKVLDADIKKSIFNTCAEDDDYVICELNDDYALINKRISVTTFFVQNSNSFCPRESYSDKVFYTGFCISWRSNERQLERAYVPVIIVKTPEGARKAILEYDGESTL